MTLKYKSSKDHFSFFFLGEDGQKVPISEWKKLESEFLSQIGILNELNNNGFADYTSNTSKVDTIEILKLTDTDKLILELPDTYPYEIFIEPDGVLTKPSFKFKYGFYDFCPNGTRLPINREEAIVSLNDCEYLLSKSQYQICEAIDEFNGLSDAEKGNITNLKRLSELKALSKESGAVLEYFLNNQELFIPEKIKIDIDFNNGALEILPKVDEIDNSIGFTSNFDRLPRVRNIYPVSGETGKTTRVLISDSQKSELEKIKKQRRIADTEKIQEIVEHPELFFDEQDIDFSVFYSERVKEIGLYSPKFYPFASPYKSQWIPGIIVKDKVSGEKRIYFKTPEKLTNFIEKKEKAVKGNKSFVEWENTEIPIDQAENLIKSAKKQFENPSHPIKEEKKDDNEVLIIKENAELTEFSKNNELPESLKHNLYEIPNLTEGIKLKEHQKEGTSWLQSLFKENLSGGLLADDMGLGKTLQLLYFIEWHCQTFNDNKPYLVVAPVSLLENWENEYKKFFNPQNIPLNKLYGSISLTRQNEPLKNKEDAKNLQFKQIILTNYATVRSYQISLGLVDFAIVALDEAQNIKTPGTLITNASKALKADFKIAMTGTPVENTLVDIWCIMDFAVPGLLGNAKDFAKEYQKPLNDDKTDVKKLTERLRDDIGVFIKRRLKRDVAMDLPTKFDDENSIIKKIMPSVQLERYKQEIELANDTNLEGVDKRNQKLKSLWALRDISDHPYLLDSQILNFSSEELILSSAKLDITVGILADIKSKQEKVIVFADRKNTQKMLQKVIYDTFDIFVSIINGDTPSAKKKINKSKLSRQQTIDQFQSKDGFNVIIMSPIAAGVGLNVTEANHIIHYSRHWNPAKEEQATDRAYRIGQEKDVYVYYPMAIFPENMKDDQGNSIRSFDEIINDLLNNKKALATNTLFPTEKAEVTPDEISGSVFNSNTASNPNPLSIEDLDRLNPNLFEASIATLYQKQGYDVYLTPQSNDKGVDVVVIGKDENFLIQVKQSRTQVRNDAIQEVYTAKTYYQNKFKGEFSLLALTNNDFSSSAEILAHANQVKLINRDKLITIIQNNEITLKDINKMEVQRLIKI